MDVTSFVLYTILILGICASQVLTVTRIPEPKSVWLEKGEEALRHALMRLENYGVAKNVILFLGDGMGVSTVTSIRILKGQQAGKPGEETVLNFEKFPHVALVKTYNTDHQTPDSAGTATAYLCGVKTKMGVLAVDDTQAKSDPNYNTDAEISSMLNWSELEGKDTGIVSTARVTHASPAAAYAKTPDRDWEDDSLMPERANCKDIATQLIEKGKSIKVILGGGRANFRPNTTVDDEYPHKKGRRTDGRDLIEEWKKARKSSHYVWNKSEFDKVDTDSTDYLLGLFEPSHMQFELDRNSNAEPSLAEMTEKAIKMLKKNDKGFFLFVEGGRIDHGHHQGKAKYAITDGLAFDEAVRVAMENTDEKETLIIVTADHSHTLTLGGYASRGHPLFEKTDHTNASDNMPYTSLLYANGPGSVAGKPRPDLTNVDTTAKDYMQQSAVPKDSETHAGEDVAVYARGPMSHLFHGVQEQSYIAHVMGYAACVGHNKEHCSVPQVVKIGPGLVCVTSERLNSGVHNMKANFLFLLSLLCMLYFSR